jgi:beta-lactamase class D
VSPVGKRSVLVGGVVIMVGIVVAAVVMLGHSGPDPASAEEDAAVSTAANPSAPDPTSAARQYLQAFASGDTAGAGTLTDDPRACSAALLDAWNTLRPNEIRANPGKVAPAVGNTASATFTVTWSLDGGHVWSYNGTLGLVRTGGNWRVHWTPAVLQPTLQAGQRLVVVTTVADHPAIVDRDGKPLAITGTSGTHLVTPQKFPQLQHALLGQPRPASPDVFAVERVDSAGRDLQTLFGTTGGQPTPLRSTLSTTVQSAAQAAVDSYGGKAVIMAMRPSDGGLLAVAQNARVSGSPFDGLYAPGSTFKIVTATAAIEAGIATKDSALPCPLTELIGTRTISNEGFSLGTTTMHKAFARSCNTTFGKLASQLPPDGLAEAADQFGLNADFSLPSLSTQTGKVVPATDSDQQVEDGIGQGTVEVSPFGEVLMAATVAAGHAVTPRLWLHTDNDTSVNTGYTAPPAQVLASLRTMMREVVTSGTGTGLAHSGTVYGKTGTAQFGSGAQAHGWFVGYRGDVAFVVFLEGANDSHPAVTLGAKFLAGVK